MNKQTKPLLTVKEQLDHLSAMGVTFNIMNLSNARDYLKYSSNYFKLCAFKKNFEKYTAGKNTGKYIDLDFAMLCDLATIDMHIRYAVLQIALGTEHFLKVKLMRKMESESEDGYQIISDFSLYLQEEDQKKNEHHYEQLKKEFSRNQDNPYCGGIINACEDGYSVWAFIEVISLGMLLRFYKFCAERFQDNDMFNDFYLMQSVRQLRNAAAHNNCIINDLQSGKAAFSPDKQMIHTISSIPKDTRDRRLSNVRILQICTLLYAHSKIASPQANHRVHELLQELIARMRKHDSYYHKNTLLIGNYKFFKKIVDILFQV